MQLQPDWLWYLQLSPLGVDRVRIRWDVSVAPEVLADQADPNAYVADLLDLLNLVNAEDRPIVEGVFRGVQRANPRRGPLSYLERNVYDFARYIARNLMGVDQLTGSPSPTKSTASSATLCVSDPTRSYHETFRSVTTSTT